MLENQQSFDPNLKKSQVPEAPTHLPGCNKTTEISQSYCLLPKFNISLHIRKIGGFAYKKSVVDTPFHRGFVNGSFLSYHLVFLIIFYFH